MIDLTRVLKVTIVLWASLSVFGCAKRVVPVATLEAQRGPASVAILSERRVDDQLQLMVQLDPVAVWPAAGVSVEVTAIRDGEEVGSRSASPKTIDGLLRPGVPVKLPLSIAAVGMTDYRLDVKWGAHGAETPEPLVAAIPQNHTDKQVGEATSLPSVGEVILADSTLSVVEHSCANDPCSIAYRYSAKLQNRTEQLINSVTLAAHFKAASGEVGEPTELAVSDLKMAPGEQRPIRVTFDAPELAPGMARLLTPTLEIVSFD